MSETEEQTILPQETVPQPTEAPPIQSEAAPIVESVPTAPIATPPIPSTPQPVQPVQVSPKSFLAKALESIQFRKKAKLEKIIKLANEKKSITNDQVQKLLRISDATATRYLSELVKQNKLKRTGTTTNTRYEPTLGSNGGN